MNGHTTDLLFSLWTPEPIQTLEKPALYEKADIIISKIVEKFIVEKAKIFVTDHDVSLVMNVNCSFDEIVQYLRLSVLNSGLRYGPIEGMFLIKMGE